LKGDIGVDPISSARRDRDERSTRWKHDVHPIETTLDFMIF
jgi:hypothetical protein